MYIAGRHQYQVCDTHLKVYLCCYCVSLILRFEKEIQKLNLYNVCIMYKVENPA